MGVLRFDCRLFGYFFDSFNSFFFWLILTKFVSVTNSFCLCRVCPDPNRKFHTSVSKKLDDSWCWLSAVIKILLSKLYLHSNILSVWVIATDVGNNTTT